MSPAKYIASGEQRLAIAKFSFLFGTECPMFKLFPAQWRLQRSPPDRDHLPDRNPPPPPPPPRRAPCLHPITNMRRRETAQACAACVKGAIIFGSRQISTCHFDYSDR